MRNPTRVTAVVVVTMTACMSGELPSDSVRTIDSSRSPDSALVSPIDSAIATATAGTEGWGYSQSAVADLDGDGEEERVVIAARVEMVRGQPAWDDGQPWQVYVQDGSERTLLYARFVQLGNVTMRVTAPDSGQRATVVILEHTPHAMIIYESVYAGPDRARTFERFRRMLDPRGDSVIR